MAGRFWLGALIFSSIAMAGCGGAPKGPSLDAQIKKATATSDPAIRAKQLAPLGEKQLAAGDVINGEKTLAFAAESAAAAEDPSNKAFALIAVANAMGRAGKTSEAKKTLRDAGKAAESIVDAGPKATALADLATAVGVHLKNADAAAVHLQAAAAAVEQVELPLQKASAFGKIMLAYDKIERPTEAAATHTKALEFINGLEKPQDKVECLADLADTMTKGQKVEEANKLFGEAQKLASELSDPVAQAYAYLAVGKRLKGAKRPDEARQAFTKADDAALKIKDGSIRNPLVAEIQAANK